MNVLFVSLVSDLQAAGSPIELPKSIATDFFSMPQTIIEEGGKVGINICHTSNLTSFDIIEIESSSAIQFSTKLNDYLASKGDPLSEGCMIVFEKIMRSYCVHTISTTDQKYKALLELFENNEKHMLLSALDCTKVSSIAVPDEEPQVIYYGAPGTGKSHQLKIDTTGAQFIRTIFHPDTDYSSFVGCYKPHDDGERISYKFQPQAFIKAYVQAWLTDRPFYLIIEEINRGNCAQIFGDIFQLLDRKDGESEYDIEPDTDLEEFLKTEFEKTEYESVKASRYQPIPNEILSGKKLRLPGNLLLRATMNTSDQSLFPMDSAFKRRWAWRYFSIKDEGKGYVIRLSDGTEYDWWKTINSINAKILSTTKSADKQLGYWFAKLPEGEVVITARDFVEKVIFYLWNDVFKDYSLGDSNAFTSDLTFEKFYSSDGKVIEQAVKDFMDRNYPKEDADATA